jgi:hypothetical protein
MRIAIHQPNFLPWYPFFQKIKEVDRFVILKECQFEKNNYQNRFNLNDRWHTMSVNKGLEPIKNKIYLSSTKDWNKIKVNLEEYTDILNSFDNCISENLFETNARIICKICSILDIDTEIVFDYSTELKSTDRLVDLCRYYGATGYLSGSGGAKEYLDLSVFGDINVEFQSNSNKVHSLEFIKDNNEIS